MQGHAGSEIRRTALLICIPLPPLWGLPYAALPPPK